jgi:multidrug efflux system outer membrane protein
MKNNLFIVGLMLVLTSCKTQKEVFKTDIQIPESYSISSEKQKIDSLAQAQVASPISWKSFFTDPMLHQLIDSAVIANFDVQIAHQRMMQARAGIQFTKGIRLPDLGLNIGSGVRRFGDYTIDGVGNYDTKFSPNLNSKQQLPNPMPDFYTGVYSTWEIDLWGKLKSKKRAALSRFLATEQGKNLILTQLVNEVAYNYYMLQLLDQELIIIKENIMLQENALEVVKIQKETGRATELAIQLMSAQVLSAKNMLLAVEIQIIELENAMNNLLGRYPQTIVRGSFSSQQDLSVQIPAGIPSEILVNRPDLQAASFELKAKNADIHAAKVAFYPSLNLNLNLGYQAFNAAFLFESPASIAYNLVGGIVAPLVNRRALKADLMLSKASQKEAYLNYEKTIVIAFTEVYEIIQKTGMLEEMKSLKTLQVAELERSISTSRILFTSGRASYLELIASQEKYLNAQVELLMIQARRTQNQLLLFKSIGGGWK